MAARTLVRNASVVALAFVANCDPYGGYGPLIQSALAATAASRGTAAPVELGLVAVTGPQRATIEAPLTACQSGELALFSGVDLAAGGRQPVAVRAVLDPLGTARVQIDSPLVSEPWTLDASRCPTFEVNIAPTNMRINGIRALSGAVRLHCTLPDETTLSVDAHFDACSTSAGILELRQGFAASRVERARIAALPSVPEAPPPSVLPAPLRDLRVAVHATVVGRTVHGDTPSIAQAACEQSDAAFVRSLGWLPTRVDQPHDLDVDFGCTGHVRYRTVAGLTAIEMPEGDVPSVRVRAGDRVIESIPRADRAMQCATATTLALTERACGERMARYASYRIAQSLAASQNLQAWAAQGHARAPSS